MTKLKYYILLFLFTYFFVAGGCIGYGMMFVLNPIKWIGFKNMYRRISQSVCYYHYALLAIAAQFLSDIEVNVYADPDIIKKIGKEKAVMVMNHKYQLDWLALLIVMLDLGILQDFKAIVKKALLWVPVIGWALYFGEAIFINRSFSADKSVLVEKLKKLAELPRFWLVLFCEGTRFTPEKHEASVKYARRKGIEPLKHHLLPRSKGFAIVRKEFDGKVSSLYDATVMCRGEEPPPLSSFISGKHERVDILIRRIPFDDVPLDEENSSAYLYELYQFKDRLCDYYLKHQKFPLDEESEFSDFVKHPMKPHRQGLLIALGWSCLLLPPLMYFVHSYLICNLSLSSLTCLPIMMISGYLVYRTMLKSGSVSSSYGQ